MPPTCSSRCSPAASCTPSAPRPWTSTARTSRRTPPWSGASSRSSSTSPASRTRSRILRGLRERYEVHHGVRITDSALVAAAVLSNRYITERFLPDKAIDLVDEAAVTAADGDGLHAGRAGRAGAAPDAARDRARGAAQGEGRRLEDAARGAREGAGRPARARRRHEGRSGSARRRSWPASARRARRSRSWPRRSRPPSGPPTTRRPPS